MQLNPYPDNLNVSTNDDLQVSLIHLSRLDFYFDKQAHER